LAPTGLRAEVERSKSVPPRAATPADVDVYFYEKEPPYETKPVATIRVTGSFPADVGVEDQEWELHERLEREARALGADTLVVMSSTAAPKVEVKAVAMIWAGKGKRPPYEGKMKKRPKPVHARGAKKKAGPATAATDEEVPSGLTDDSGK
jgi:hypothetical protein